MTIDRGTKRHSLGQHFLVSPETCRKMVSAAHLTDSDTVLEIGTGKGFLTEFIAPQARLVVTCEKDPLVFADSKTRLANLQNVKLVYGDAFRSREIERLKFDVCITSLPYSRSLDFVRWLSIKSGFFRSCIALVQTEFAEKMTASPHCNNYKSVSVLAQIGFRIQELGSVEKRNFAPLPKVQTSMVKFIANHEFIQPFFDAKKVNLLTLIFSFRGRLLRNALRSIEGKSDSILGRFQEDLLLKRVEDVTPKEYAKLLDALSRKRRRGD
jgi:16S rRNA (adenine1518-N6/adenine1519-N6)-dimethyltransferase